MRFPILGYGGLLQRIDAATRRYRLRVTKNRCVLPLDQLVTINTLGE